MRTCRIRASLVLRILLPTTAACLSLGTGCPGTGDPSGAASSSGAGGASRLTPWPSITAPGMIEGDVGKAIAFAATVQNGTAPVNVKIGADDGWSVNEVADASGGVTATHAFDQPGYYLVSYEVTDNEGRFTFAFTTVFIRTPSVKQYPLTAGVRGEGTVSPASGQYDANTSVTLRAGAKTGWKFDHWEGDLSGNANPATLVMNGDKAVTAVFKKKMHLQIYVQGEGTVTYKIGENNRVALTAVAASGWKFDHWEGDLGGSANPAEIVVDADKEVTAVFVETGEDKDDGSGGSGDDGDTGDGGGDGGGGGTGSGDYPRCYTGWAKWTLRVDGAVTCQETVRGILYVPRAYMPSYATAEDEWETAYFRADSHPCYPMREKDKLIYVGIQDGVLSFYEPMEQMFDTDAPIQYDDYSSSATIHWADYTDHWEEPGGPIREISVEFTLQRNNDLNACKSN